MEVFSILTTARNRLFLPLSGCYGKRHRYAGGHEIRDPRPIFRPRAASPLPTQTKPPAFCVRVAGEHERILSDALASRDGVGPSSTRLRGDGI